MDNKKNITEQGLALFSARGYDAVGVQEICLVCNITKPTLYHFFGSKRGLLEAVFEEYYPAFVLSIQQSAEYHRDLIMNLEALANCFFRFALDNPEINRFILTASYSPPQSEVHGVQKKYSDQINESVKELFILAIPEHGNLRNKERQLTASFIGVLRGYVGLFIGGETELNDTIARSLVKQFMYGIYA